MVNLRSRKLPILVVAAALAVLAGACKKDAAESPASKSRGRMQFPVEVARA